MLYYYNSLEEGIRKQRFLCRQQADNMCIRLQNIIGTT